MLKIVTGPYYPDLEQALVDEVRQFKSADPLTPLALVVPSDSLRRRLKWLLCVERQCALFDVHVLTFHQLALQLYHEQRTLQDGCKQGPPIELVSDLFFERLLSHIARRKMAGLQGLDLSGLAPGAWSALWATVRDLKDATVDPAAALRGVSERLFESEDMPKLQALFTLYAAVRKASQALSVGLVDDMASVVMDWVPASRFLARLKRMCYYGFYDLTQVQLSLFEAVVKHAPVTLYFPLGDGPAFAFARRFFESHVEVLLSASEQIVRTAGLGSTKRAAEPSHVRIMNAVGPDDELTLVCKEVLTLVETKGYQFQDIGVVMRTLDPYHATLRRTFDQHRIPFTTTAVSSVLQEPAAKALLQLASLALTGFYRAHVLDVLSSPCYRIDRQQMGGVEPRPDLWHLAVRSLGITRGEDEWQKLASVGQVRAWIGEGEPDEEPFQGRRDVQIDVAQIRLLWRVVSQLIQDCRALPDRGSFTDLSEAFAALAHKHLAMPGLMNEEGDHGDVPGQLVTVGEVVRSVLAQLSQLDRLGETVSWEDWTETFTQSMERATMPIEPFDHPGVQVLDAMAARGVPFKALFLLGLNEKVFPRYIREDAFLRDRHRRVLDVTLGYKIDEKLAGYDEEQLLFALLQRSAQQRLYLIYQRADMDGRPFAASAYLDDFLRTSSGQERAPDLILPRRLSERSRLPLFAPPLLTREELALSWVLHNRDPSPLLEAAGREATLFQNGVEALRVIDGEAHSLGQYDGLTGKLDRHWSLLAARGLAPTPLEQYARCPFQYFSAQVLRLETVRHEAVEEVPAEVMGELCHAALRTCYQRLVEAGWPQHEVLSASIQATVRDSVEEVFAAYAAHHGTGYPLTWQLAKETIVTLVTAVVGVDQQDCRASGFVPVGFEVEAEGTLEDLGPELKDLKVRGRLDRIDQQTMKPKLRIVDYKYRHGREMRDQDRNLVTSAVRGFRLQPPLYSLMRATVPAQGVHGASAKHVPPELVEFIFLAPHWEPIVDRAQFPASAWQGAVGQQLRKTLQVLIEGVRTGQYFILPDGYCDYCDFSAACRRFHGPTWWRAYSSGRAGHLRRLRKQKVSP